MALLPQKCLSKPGLFTVHFFGSVQMVMVSENHGCKWIPGNGFHIIAVGTWTVPEKLGLLRFGLRSLVKSAVRLRSGLRFQVKPASRFRSGLHSNIFLTELQHLPCLQL